MIKNTATPSDQRTTPRALRTQALQTDTPFFDKGNTNLTRDLPTRILATPPFKSPHLTLRRGSRPCHPSSHRPDLGQPVPFVLCPVLLSRLGRPALSRAHDKPSCRMGELRHLWIPLEKHFGLPFLHGVTVWRACYHRLRNSSSGRRQGLPFCRFRRRHFLGSTGPRCARGRGAGSGLETLPQFSLQPVAQGCHCLLHVLVNSFSCFRVDLRRCGCLCLLHIVLVDVLLRPKHLHDCCVDRWHSRCAR